MRIQPSASWKAKMRAFLYGVSTLWVCAVMPAWAQLDDAKLRDLVAKADGICRAEWREALVPDLTGTNIWNEQEMNVHQFHGKVVLVNFIAPG